MQEGAVLHTDAGFPMRIGNCVSIGHQAALHGCQIGEGTLILIAGCPAKVVRELEAEDIASPDEQRQRLCRRGQSARGWVSG